MIIVLVGIRISPLNPESGIGWKYTPDWNKEPENLMKMMEGNSYSASDVFVAKDYEYDYDYEYKTDETSSNKSIRITNFYAGSYGAMNYVLHLQPGVITQDLDTTFTLYLNKTLSHYLFISDPKLMISVVRPDPIPRFVLKLDKGIKETFLFFKVCFETCLALFAGSTIFLFSTFFR